LRCLANWVAALFPAPSPDDGGHYGSRELVIIMGSFLKSFRKDVGSAAPSVGAPPPKKEPQPLPMTPLEKMLTELGPIRGDGSDKFYGMENVSVH
jgi:hypothetical protein